MKLQYDKLLSDVAFKSNLRRYTKEGEAAAPEAAAPEAAAPEPLAPPTAGPARYCSKYPSTRFESSLIELRWMQSYDEASNALSGRPWPTAAQQALPETEAGAYTRPLLSST